MPSVASHETLVRQLQMLHLIPRSPAQITVADLTQALKDQGYQVTSRTVQRDLNDISLVMPLECNDRSKPYGWKWSREGRTHLPMMGLQEALTLHLVQSHLTKLLPPTMLDDLMPMFKQALQTLTGLGDKHQLQHWLTHVVVESPMQPMLAPELSQAIQETVYQAVFEQKQLEVTYQSPSADQPKAMVLHPLGLVQRGPVTYLGATVNEYEDIRFFALHRFKTVQIKHLDRAQPRNKLTWKAYLASGAAGFNIYQLAPITLEAWISQELANILMETPLSEDQLLVKLADGYQLSAQVNDTWQLTWWILSQGGRMVVQQPTALRDKIKDELSRAIAGYVA